MGGSGGFKTAQEGNKDLGGNRHGLWKFMTFNYGDEIGRQEISYHHGLMHGRVFYRQTHFHTSSHSYITIKNYTRDIEEGEMLFISTEPNM
jgi:hypothetical protein